MRSKAKGVEDAIADVGAAAFGLGLIVTLVKAVGRPPAPIDDGGGMGGGEDEAEPLPPLGPGEYPAEYAPGEIPAATPVLYPEEPAAPVEVPAEEPGSLEEIEEAEEKEVYRRGKDKRDRPPNPGSWESFKEFWMGPPYNLSEDEAKVSYAETKARYIDWLRGGKGGPQYASPEEALAAWKP